VHGANMQTGEKRFGHCKIRDISRFRACGINCLRRGRSILTQINEYWTSPAMMSFLQSNILRLRRTT